MKKIDVNGIKVHIDRPIGFVQHGKDKTGKAWSRTYKFDYGFIPKTDGGDKEDLDVFVGHASFTNPVYVATQCKEDGTFDEYKLFVGFDSVAKAKAAYLAHIPAKFLSSMKELPMGILKALCGVTPTEKEASALTGALVGAGLGGIGGAALDEDHRVRGALIGAGLGGVGGAGLGHMLRTRPGLATAAQEVPAAVPAPVAAVRGAAPAARVSRTAVQEAPAPIPRSPAVQAPTAHVSPQPSAAAAAPVAMPVATPTPPAAPTAAAAAAARPRGRYANEAVSPESKAEAREVLQGQLRFERHNHEPLPAEGIHLNNLVHPNRVLDEAVLSQPVHRKLNVEQLGPLGSRMDRREMGDILHNGHVTDIVGKSHLGEPAIMGPETMQEFITKGDPQALQDNIRAYAKDGTMEQRRAVGREIGMAKLRAQVARDPNAVHLDHVKPGTDKTYRELLGTPERVAVERAAQQRSHQKRLIGDLTSTDKERDISNFAARLKPEQRKALVENLQEASSPDSFDRRLIDHAMVHNRTIPYKYASALHGALIGAGLGGLTGAAVDDKHRLRGALIGAAGGGAIGAGVGASMKPSSTERLLKDFKPESVHVKQHYRYNMEDAEVMRDAADRARRRAGASVAFSPKRVDVDAKVVPSSRAGKAVSGEYTPPAAKAVPRQQRGQARVYDAHVLRSPSSEKTASGALGWLGGINRLKRSEETERAAKQDTRDEKPTFIDNALMKVKW